MLLSFCFPKDVTEAALKNGTGHVDC